MQAYPFASSTLGDGALWGDYERRGGMTLRTWLSTQRDQLEQACLIDDDGRYLWSDER
jgi:hypothetical protein